MSPFSDGRDLLGNSDEREKSKELVHDCVSWGWQNVEGLLISFSYGVSHLYAFTLSFVKLVCSIAKEIVEDMSRS